MSRPLLSDLRRLAEDVRRTRLAVLARRPVDLSDLSPRLAALVAAMAQDDATNRADVIRAAEDLQAALMQLQAMLRAAASEPVTAP